MLQVPSRLLRCGVLLFFSAVVALAASRSFSVPAVTASPPARLEETGLYRDMTLLKVDPAHLAFSPQYSLWSDGATKRRWISLPRGTTIDASDPDAWVFPVGTRLWKEFSFAGHRVETRFMERRPNGWHYAAYEWSSDGRQATLAPVRGRRGAFPLKGGRSHVIPGVNDCKVCHQANVTEVLGFSALQLSPDRDPGAPHAETPPTPQVDLRFLTDAGLVTGLPSDFLTAPPGIPAGNPQERSALGYLHANCGHCHNDGGSLSSLQFFLRQTAASRQPVAYSAIGQPVRKPAPGQSANALLRIEAGYPHRSAIVDRMSSRYPALQMPPLGTELVDKSALLLIQEWIAGLPIEETEAPSREE